MSNLVHVNRYLGPVVYDDFYAPHYIYDAYTLIDQPRFGETWLIHRVTMSVDQIPNSTPPVTGIPFYIYMNGTLIGSRDATGSSDDDRVFTHAPNGPIIYRPGDTLQSRIAVGYSSFLGSTGPHANITTTLVGERT